ncbi:MAG TPA: RDD family protein, partial [Candidatus Acidoferrum sp.]|nr:RDD family protein [Candidatus Acidoferrum sp.]
MVAALADVIILGVAINLLALPFFNVLSRIGAWGGLIGFCVSFPYFAILNSRIGDGQTLGKRWMNLRVIDSTGESISFGQSS